MDLIQKSGSFYSYNNERIGQGRDNAKRYLLDKPDVFDALDRQIRGQQQNFPDKIVIYNKKEGRNRLIAPLIFFLIHPDWQYQIGVFISFERFNDTRTYTVSEIHDYLFIFYNTECIFQIL